QCRIADDVLRQLHFADDVRDGKPTTKLQQTVDLTENLGLVHREVDDSVTDDGIDRGRRIGDIFDVALQVRDIGELIKIAQTIGFGELLICHVHTDDLAVAPDLQGGKECVHAGAAAEIEDGFAVLQSSEMEVVANPGKRFDRLLRNRVEISGRISKTFRHRASHFEMKVAVRILGHAAVHG